MIPEIDKKFHFVFNSWVEFSKTKPAVRKCNQLIDAVVTIIEYKKRTIYPAIKIKVFYDGTVSYLTVSTDDVINTTNNETEFPELKIFFKEPFDINKKDQLLST